MFLSISSIQVFHSLKLLCRLFELEVVGMASNSSLEIDGDMEVEAFRRLFPLRYYEHYLGQSVRPDARPLAHARETTIALGTWCA